MGLLLNGILIIWNLQNSALLYIFIRPMKMNCENNWQIS